MRLLIDQTNQFPGRKRSSELMLAKIVEEGISFSYMRQENSASARMVLTKTKVHTST